MTDGIAPDHAARGDTSVTALLGSLVADAVAMPVHWYYDRAALDRGYPQLAGNSTNPQLAGDSTNPQLAGDSTNPQLAGDSTNPQLAGDPTDPQLALGYLAPRNPHPDSILWRSHWSPPDAKHDILRDQGKFWGVRGVHYHQFLAAGENTLNFQLAVELFAWLRRTRDYDPERWLDHYVAFMLEPGRHRDTYVEEYHRHFFTNLAAGRKPINCGVRDVHIGGLAQVPALVAGLGPRHPDLPRIVRLHVSLTHKDDEVLAAADALGRILVRVTRDDRPDADRDLRAAILDEARDWISAAKVAAWEARAASGPPPCPDRAVIGGVLSPACYIEDAFPAALYLAWRHAGDFAAGVRANALCGGDNCHRGAVVGSLLAARSSIPHPLLAGLLAGARIADVACP